MGARSVSGDRDTPMLLPPDLRDWVPEDDLVHFVAMRDKLPTEEGKALYGRRNHPVEPVFDIIKAAMGFRGFRLRGKENLSGKWTLGCLPYNPKRLHGMMESATNGAGDPKSRSTGRNPFRISPGGGWLGRIIHTISRGSTAWPPSRPRNLC